MGGEPQVRVEPREMRQIARRKARAVCIAEGKENR